MQIDLFRDPPPAPLYQAPVYRVCLVREASVPMDRPQLRGSETAANLLRTYLANADREHFVVMMLDRKNRIIGLSIKAKDIEDERAAVREHRSKESERPGAQTLGDLIKAQMDQNAQD